MILQMFVLTTRNLSNREEVVSLTQFSTPPDIYVYDDETKAREVASTKVLHGNTTKLHLFRAMMQIDDANVSKAFAAMEIRVWKSLLYNSIKESQTTIVHICTYRRVTRKYDVEVTECL